MLAAGTPLGLQAALVDAVAGFLQRGTQGQLEHSRPLVRWLLRCAASPQALVRGAVLRRAALFAEPQVVLTMWHEGEHPIHSRDREVQVEQYEAQASTACPAHPAVPQSSWRAHRACTLPYRPGTASRAAPCPFMVQMLQALREELEAAATAGDRAGSASTGESIREGLVQVGGGGAGPAPPA